MIEKIKSFIKKNEELVSYVIVGGLTTVVSWIAQFLLNYLAFNNTLYPTPAQSIALSTTNWIAGVIFAYFTNRKYVFKSNNSMLLESFKFVLSRVSTLIMYTALLELFGYLKFNLLVSTILGSIVVVIANYIISKIFVFNKKDNNNNQTTIKN